MNYMPPTDQCLNCGHKKQNKKITSKRIIEATTYNAKHFLVLNDNNNGRI